MNNPKLTVVIPNWNGSKFLPDMLDSIIRQTYNDWVLYVIDDGSTDNSKEIVTGYHKKDERIRLVLRDKEPKGAQTCRNIGTKLAKGSTYIIYFDSDDIVAPYCFEQRVLYMDKNPQLDFSIFPAKKFSKHIWDYEKNRNRVYGCKFIDDILVAMFHKTLPMVVWNNIYRMESIQKFDLSWDEHLLSMQDSDYNIQAILKGCEYRFAENVKPDYFYRRVETGISIGGQLKRTHFPGHIYLLDKVTKSLTDIQRKKYKHDLDIYCLNFSHISIDKEYGKSFYSIDWLKGRWWFILRMIICAHLHPKLRFLVFPLIGTQDLLLKRKWEKFMDNKSKEFIANYGKS